MLPSEVDKTKKSDHVVDFKFVDFLKGQTHIVLVKLSVVLSERASTVAYRAWICRKPRDHICHADRAKVIVWYIAQCLAGLKMRVSINLINSVNRGNSPTGRVKGK